MCISLAIHAISPPRLSSVVRHHPRCAVLVTPSAGTSMPCSGRIFRQIRTHHGLAGMMTVAVSPFSFSRRWVSLKAISQFCAPSLLNRISFMVMSNNSMQTNSRCPQRWLHHFWFGWQFALQSFRTAAVADLAVLYIWRTSFTSCDLVKEHGSLTISLCRSTTNALALRAGGVAFFESRSSIYARCSAQSLT